MTPLQQIVDHFLSLKHYGDDQYPRHVKDAKKLLELCDGDPDKAIVILDRTQAKIGHLEGWSMRYVIMNYLDLNK